jgi:hypothetical protein
MIGTGLGLAVGLPAVAQLGVHVKGHRPVGLLTFVGMIGGCFGLFASMMAFWIGVMAEYPREPVPWWQCEIAIFICVVISVVLLGMMGMVFVKDQRDAA